MADDRDDRDEAVAVAGAYVRDAIAHLCGESLQLHGGIGFTWEHDVHLYLRRAKVGAGPVRRAVAPSRALCASPRRRSPEPMAPEPV